MLTLDLKKSNFQFDLNVELPYYFYTNLNNNTYWDLASLSLACDMEVTYCMQDTYSTKSVKWWDREVSLLVNKFYAKVK